MAIEMGASNYGKSEVRLVKVGVTPTVVTTCET